MMKIVTQFGGLNDFAIMTEPLDKQDKALMSSELSGFVNIYKPLGVSSFDVVKLLKRIFGISKKNKLKIGHCGTLDPMAEGILPIALGQATKLVSYVQDNRKEYIFDLTFGVMTDSLDREGNIIAYNNNLPTLQSVKQALQDLVGENEQKTPCFSAVKMEGRRAYDIARKKRGGVDSSEQNIDFIELEKTIFLPVEKNRIVTLYSLEILECYGVDKIKDEVAKVRIKILCSKGTYIRSVAYDIAKQCGCLGYMSGLKRSRVGAFTEGNSLKINVKKLLDEDKGAICLQNTQKDIMKSLLDLEFVLDDIAGLTLNEAESYKHKNGIKLKITEKLSDSVTANSLVKVIDGSGTLLSLSDVYLDNNGDYILTVRRGFC